MPESLSIDSEIVESLEEYPVSVTLRHLPKDDALLGKPNGADGTDIPNGLFRSNLTADKTDSILESAKVDNAGHSEKILAKYVVGCDGAHSWVRRQIGCVMEGEQTDFIWCIRHTISLVKHVELTACRGVLDIIPITDFRTLTSNDWQ